MSAFDTSGASQHAYLGGMTGTAQRCGPDEHARGRAQILFLRFDCTGSLQDLTATEPLEVGAAYRLPLLPLNGA